MRFTEQTSKHQIFDIVTAMLAEKNIRIASHDDQRPWGGFFVINEADAAIFIAAFFPHLSFNALNISGKLSPKILIVAPFKRLSWQYHHRRAEIWKLINGEAAIVKSDTDIENTPHHLSVGDVVELQQGERHRLVGTTNWGIIAEIWRHTDAENPSDENDIIRLQDDFGR